MKLPGPDWLAPAKLNLFLHVVGRRDDGYHLLQTVFTLIDRCDRLRLRVREDARIERVNVVPGVAPDDDLAVRAARLLQEASGAPLGADIEIEKAIPIGGGLGGGSSDAATVLIASRPGRSDSHSSRIMPTSCDRRSAQGAPPRRWILRGSRSVTSGRESAPKYALHE